MTRVFLVLGMSLVALGTALSAQNTATPKATAVPKAAAVAERVIAITANDKDGVLSYSPATITATVGEALRIRLKATSSTMPALPKIAMAHNFVLLKPTANALQFVNDAATAGPVAGYIPAGKKDQVIAVSPLAGVGETVEVAFKAPAAGTYPFVCTFPGHYSQGMRGRLIVK